MSTPVPRSTGRDDSPDPASHAATIYDQAEDWVDEESGDDDMDFEDSTRQGESEELEYFEASENDGDGEFQDADDGLSGVEIEISIETGDTSTEAAEASGEARTGATSQNTPAAAIRAPVQVSRNQILQLLGHAGLRRIFASHGGASFGLADLDEDDDEDDSIEGGYGSMVGRRRRKRKVSTVEFPKVPSDVGRELMNSGNFGSNEYYQDILRRKKQKLARRILSRELALDPLQNRRGDRLLSQLFEGLIPSSNADTIIHYNARCYSGQFSDDGNFFFSCGQDFKVRMYDTSNPYEWKYYKTVVYPSGQWTITDATLSPDNKYLAYSSIRSTVCLAATDPSESGEPWLLDFADTAGSRGHRAHHGYSQFGIWSIRFSGDGREIVAGTGDHSVYVYDIESRRSILRIPGHTEDVNAVCFGDQSSPHILYSGSDDTLIKVWDRRSMGDSREAGVFMGHTEGLTYVDSKGDGRYVLSNGKDQTMKLWDLRKMMSTTEASRLTPSRYTTSFDYRFMNYSDTDYTPHPHDKSLVTFRGHKVLKTLIRCHFSPSGSTNSRYVYTGSADGSVYVYNLDATLAGKVDVNRATHHSRRREPDSYTATYDMDDRRQGQWKTCVRDASWHPNAPVIAATSWNGWGESTGTCTIHSWNDGAEEDEAEPTMGRRVDQRLQENENLYGDIPSSRRNIGSRLRSRGVAAVPTVTMGDDEEDDDGW
ncbi:hypothetical protein MMC11_007424 [Xylographa trunciseda]|nr:hypothetical protein [Xylographa trunciseda]